MSADHRFPPTLLGAQSAVIAAFDANPQADIVDALAAILRAHGAKRVRDLPSDRYGAFIADVLSRIPIEGRPALLRVGNVVYYGVLPKCPHRRRPSKTRNG